MRQSMKEYQKEFFEKEGHIIFDSLEEAAAEICRCRGISMEMAIEGMENDTNTDCKILNDGSVAIDPRSKLLVKKEKKEELYEKMKRGEITKLKFYLYDKDMTVAQLAEAADLNKRTLDEYVSGRREIKTIALEKGLRIAKALGCDIYNII